MEFKFFGREIYIKKSLLILSAFILLVLLAIIGYLIKIREQPIIFISQDEKPVVTTNNAASTSTENKPSSPTPKEVHEEIKVYITGCVKKPGIITLKKGQLIYDAINAAGGLTDDADKNINMVYALNENVWLNVKSKKKAEAVTENKASSSGTSTKTSKPDDNKGSGKAAGNSGTVNSGTASNGAASNEAGNGISIIKDSGGVLPSEKSQGDAGTSAKININTASAEELDALPGIGPAIAEDIVDYRNKNGEFKAIEDLLNVPGIGQSKFNRLKDNVTLK